MRLQLLKGRRIIDERSLTISQDFDTLLIGAIDNLLERNRIDRLSLNSVGIRGKIDNKAIWGMILRTASLGLDF
ncbi:MAG: hypothetical protein A3B99_02875 [Candidatus Yanofskybacteria bacterium RIFCSPHIGHO2_02_FULL_44_12b]|nr:MAG: hypothetical protein A3B99_02875 [Candidatus Yanofskybacteria bacterium RIFCSPHIGHO2_02_FULL_44_12b]OGN26891.1 MAG: hypothetical protein A2925_01310 [Candidatus Yanofskybacteria bacterium RIFCSPLOWO2_01_FULL_44_22]